MRNKFSMQVLVDNRQQPIEIVAWGPGLLLPSFDPECLAVMVRLE